MAQHPNQICAGYHLEEQGGPNNDWWQMSFISTSLTEAQTLITAMRKEHPQTNFRIVARFYQPLDF